MQPAAEIAAVDLRDRAEAHRSVPRRRADRRHRQQQHGEGAHQPTRIDLSGYQNLCAAARNTGVRRLIYVSYQGVSQDAPVDIFRVKWYIEDAIRRSGVPHVMLRPTAFMDIWIDQILAKGIREKGVATIFGDGNSVANYIAVDDVARIRGENSRAPEIVNEAVDAGGPSNVSQTIWRRSSSAASSRRGSGGTCRSRRCACSLPSSGPSTKSRPG